MLTVLDRRSNCTLAPTARNRFDAGSWLPEGQVLQFAGSTHISGGKSALLVGRSVIGQILEEGK